MPILIILGLSYLYPFGRDYHISNTKINGVSLVGTPYEIHLEDISQIKDVRATWISLIPYAFSIKDKPHVYFNTKKQWWGEKIDGIILLSSYAKNNQMKILMKPHVWVRGDGWPGEFELTKESDWEKWEDNYRNYILTYARLADSLKVDLFCLGTEYRKAAVLRKTFWKGLIREVKKIYTGKLTYAANWDNYQKIEFWNQLDYIGIDAYFPLSTSKTPTYEELKKAWIPLERELKVYAEKHKKTILFTEYGYQSKDYNCSGHWNVNSDTISVNMISQKNAYHAFYDTFWDKDWIAGGFLWKWYPGKSDSGGPFHKEYTPQNKPAMEVIRKYYELTSSL